MKTFRKILALLLAAVMMLSLSACGTFELKLAKGMKNLAEYENFHADVSLSMSYGVEFLGRTLDLGTDINYAADIQKEPFKMSMRTDVSLMDINGTLYGYMENQGNSCVVAASADGEEWNSETVDAPELPDSGEAAAIGVALSKYLGNFRKAGNTEQVGGSEAQRYDGSISGSDLKELLEVTGGADKLDDELEGGYNPAMIDDDCEIPMALWLDRKTGVILKAEAELGSIIEGIVRETVRTELELPEDVELNINVSSAYLSIRLSQFDAVDEIRSPLK